MSISIKKAFKAPFEKGILVMALFPAIVSILGVSIIPSDNTAFSKVPGIPYSSIIMAMIIFLSIISSLIISGYNVLFAYNTFKNQTPLFPKLSWNILIIGLKTFLFSIGYLIILSLISIPISLIAVNINVFLTVIVISGLLAFALLYLYAASTGFLETFNPLEPFRIGANLRMIKNHWKGLLTLLFLMFLTGLILIVPLVLLKILFSLIAVIVPVSIYIMVYAISLLMLYPGLVSMHLFGQFAASIKQLAKEPTVLKKTDTLINQKKTPKRNAKKIVSKSVNTPKTAQKSRKK